MSSILLGKKLETYPYIQNSINNAVINHTKIGHKNKPKIKAELEKFAVNIGNKINDLLGVDNTEYDETNFQILLDKVSKQLINLGYFDNFVGLTSKEIKEEIRNIDNLELSLNTIAAHTSSVVAMIVKGLDPKLLELSEKEKKELIKKRIEIARNSGIQVLKFQGR